MCFHCLPLGSIDFPLGSALILSYLILSYLISLSYLILSLYLILSYLFLVFCFPARFWCQDICDGFKYPRGYPHVRQRLIVSMAALENWHMHGLDVRNAYLYGELDEEIYMEQPEGFSVPGKAGHVLRLRRALYGLKQAGLAWW